MPAGQRRRPRRSVARPASSLPARISAWPIDSRIAAAALRLARLQVERPERVAEQVDGLLVRGRLERALARAGGVVGRPAAGRRRGRPRGSGGRAR